MSVGVAVRQIADEDVRAALESLLDGRRVVAVHRTFLEYSSSSTIDAVDAEVDDGIVLNLVLKDSSPAARLPDARSRPDAGGSPTREIDAYACILPGAPEGPPRWLGASVDVDRERWWLFLERVPGLQLQHVGDIAVWADAARWLGRFHATSHPMLEDAARSLPTYDADFYRSWLTRASAFGGPNLGRRDAGRLTNLASRFGELVDRLVALPTSVVHGDFCAANVVVRPDGRICPLDWERIAIGPPLVDLAALTAGNWSAAARDALIRAYEAGAGAPVDRADLELCRLYLALQWAGWSENWVAPEPYAGDWLGLALSIGEDVAR